MTSKPSTPSSEEVKPERASQEFYCGACEGYFMVRLNMALNHEVHVKCPKCGHEHRRVIKGGVIYDNGRYKSEVVENILTTMATYHKEPVTVKMKKAQKWGRRDGIELTDIQLLRWHEVAQREETGEEFDD
jgi:predicted RNA-binding Zn-ribbon protein involved in translation (DUF1610 family)